MRRYPRWTLNYTLSKDAIIISPDYRLLPEHTGHDILQDVADFYTWLRKPGNLSSQLPEGFEVDLENILVTGETAGGYLALVSALTQRNIAAAIAHYPMIDMKGRHFAEKYEKPLFDAGTIPPGLLDQHLSSMKKGEVVTSRLPPDGSALVGIMIQQGSFPEDLGSDSSLYSLDVLDTVDVKSLPPIWILHGNEDEVVPVDRTEKFVEKLSQTYPEVICPDGKLMLTIEAGGHGFDESATQHTEWVKAGLEWLGEYWPMF